MKPQFIFDLTTKVAIKASGEKGEVRGRAEYTDTANQYMVGLVDAHGSYKEVWLAEDVLEAVA